jgi:hypothetical protein
MALHMGSNSATRFKLNTYYTLLQYISVALLATCLSNSVSTAVSS